MAPAQSSYPGTTQPPAASFDPALASASPRTKGDSFVYSGLASASAGLKSESFLKGDAYGYPGSAIDPALERVASAAGVPPHGQPGPLDFKGGVGSFSWNLSQQSPRDPDQSSLAYANCLAKMRVDDLIALGGFMPPAPPAGQARDALDELVDIYFAVYVPGLCGFFETSWYDFRPGGPNPTTILINNRPVIDLLLSFLNSVQSVRTAGSAGMAVAGDMETRVVWSLASLAYTTPGAINRPGDAPVPSDDATEARNRLAVFETLLSGGSLTSNPCVPPPTAGEPHRIRELEFWWYLAEYLRLQDTPQSSYAAQRGRKAGAHAETARRPGEPRRAVLAVPPAGAVAPVRAGRGLGAPAAPRRDGSPQQARRRIPLYPVGSAHSRRHHQRCPEICRAGREGLHQAGGVNIARRA